MNENILIVDDEPNFRFSAELALKKRGYTISETGDGEDAFARILDAESNRTPFDLVLLDMDLPSLSGIEIMRKLHGMKITVPVIVISGHIPTDIYKELLALGCTDIFFKPISEKILIARVTELLQKAKAKLTAE